MTNSADPDQVKKPTDLDLHFLQRQGLSGFSRTRVKKIHPAYIQKALTAKIGHQHAIQSSFVS